MLPTVILFAACAVSPPMGAGGTDSSSKEMERLSGRWNIISIESADQEVRWKGMSFVFNGEELIWEDDSGTKNNRKISYKANPKTVNHDQITYKINPHRRPKQIDVTFVRAPGTVVDGRTLLGIYSIDGDRLTICWTHKEGKRPTRFTGKKEPTLFILERDSPWAKSRSTE
jgi:uncharacterized protein (TIGR03067 family)